MFLYIFFTPNLTAAYARYSSDNQRAESIDAQVGAITSWAASRHFQIVKTYVDEARSATTDNRPAFLKMIRDSEAGLFDAVIVHKLDRFSRDRFDSAFYKRELKKNGVRLYSVLEDLDGSPESIILESVLEGMAEYYSKNLAREVMKGLHENAKSCRHTGGLPPLGYDLNPDKTYKINEREATAVRMIFEMYLRGDGYSLILDTLDASGYKTKRGQPFGKNSLNSILQNEKYTGIYIYNRTERVQGISGKVNIVKPESEIIRIPGGMPRIIEPELFEEVRKRMETGKRKTGQNSAKRVYILSGLIVCGKCGAAMIGRTGHMGRNRSLYSYYDCSARKRLRTCDAKPVNTEYIENLVIDALYENLLSPEVLESATDMIYSAAQKSQGSLVDDTKELQKELSQVEQKIENLVNAVADGLYDSSMKEKLSELRNRQELLSRRLSEASILLSIQSLLREQISDYLRRFQDIKTLQPKDQKKAVGMFVRKVTVHEDSVDLEILTTP